MNQQYIAILGRQPAFGVAELESVFGGKSVKILSPESAQFESKKFDIQNFGGILKAGKIISQIDTSDWQKVSNKIIADCISLLSSYEGKITFGISAYNFKINYREIQKVGIILKQSLKKHNVSMRLIPNSENALSSATSHHNKLGLSQNKIELIIIKTNDGKTIIASSTGSQNITAYANRDQARPKRDAFVGMLPPKLAQIMINLAIGNIKSKSLNSDPKSIPPKDGIPPKAVVVLDPFCGTGVILQEAAIMGYSVYGTDLSEKMIRYSRDNLNWLIDTHYKQFEWYLHEGDAMTTKWRQPINAVVCESYLGQPFSAPPSPAKLSEVVDNCNYIITEFLRNLRDQIEPGTPICIAVPAWRNKDGSFTHLPIIDTVARFGYKPHEFLNVSKNDLIYYRPDQVVARELLVLIKV